MDTKSLAHEAHSEATRNDARPKSAACDGCDHRFRRRKLVELTEDNHDDLTYFHGDKLCEVCAAQHGVL